MRLKILACKVLYRELSYLSALCPYLLDVTYMRQGLHNTPESLRSELQKEIDAIDLDQDIHTGTEDSCGPIDAILLAYGLCSNGVCGLSSKKYPLVVPRAHDCNTLFLGSKERYREYFDTYNGIYWYTPGWLENAPMPSETMTDRLMQLYTELYGEDNAEYLVDLELGWYKKYTTGAYIRWKELPFPQYEAYTKRCTQYLNWTFRLFEGSSELLREFLSGSWDEERFLVVPPGRKIAPSFDERILCVE